MNEIWKQRKQQKSDWSIIIIVKIGLFRKIISNNNVDTKQEKKIEKKK